jgi:hypothetical protein|tara:strand:- start:3998 stop:4684 length:687 start_codon:yes stop_codon:yes gene_type:complete
MATSGTRTFTLEVDEIIEEAFSRIGGEPQTGKEASQGRRSLNLMLQDWTNRNVQLWTVSSESQALVANTTSYTLTSSIIDIEDAVIQVTNSDSSTTDMELERISRDDYLKIPNKNDTGRPSQFFLDKQLTPVLFLYPTPSNSSDIFKYSQRKKIEDITSSTENVAVPDRFLPCAISGLAYYLSLKRPQIEIQRRQELKMLYEEEFKRATEDNREKVDLIIRPDLRYNS